MTGIFPAAALQPCHLRLLEQPDVGKLSSWRFCSSTRTSSVHVGQKYTLPPMAHAPDYLKLPGRLVETKLAW